MKYTSHSHKDSTHADKKYMVTTPGGKTIHFGAKNYNDYITYNHEHGKKIADDKRDAYIARHQVNEDWYDPDTAGFWSRWLLWEKPTLRQAGNNLRDLFDIKIKFLGVLDLK